MARTVGMGERLVREIVHRVRSVVAPTRVIVFGSAAAGRMTPSSDIDLLILEANPADPFEESVRIWDALRGLGYAFDVIVMAAARFQETKHVIGGIAYPANKYGKVIYEAA
jgi:uncharacterized protein